MAKQSILSVLTLLSVLVGVASAFQLPVVSTTRGGTTSLNAVKYDKKTETWFVTDPEVRY